MTDQEQFKTKMPTGYECLNYVVYELGTIYS